MEHIGCAQKGVPAGVYWQGWNCKETTIKAFPSARTVRSTCIAAITLCACVESKAFGGEHEKFEPRREPKLPLAVPRNFDVTRVPVESWQAPKEWSVTDFKPRASLNLGLGLDPNATQSLRQTTVWQRLADYRGRDGVRLLTLWELPGSTLSIQTTRHGEPTLQWSSSSMNRGGATRGLFDSMIAASLGAAGFSQIMSARGNSAGSVPLNIKPVLSHTARAPSVP